MSKIPNHTIEILNSLSCEDVAEKLGMNVIKHKTLCFMHEDHHPSLYFSGKNKEWWRCFVCNKGGNAINLVMEYAGIGFVEACQWLGEQFNINLGIDRVINLEKKTINVKKRTFNNEIKPFSKAIAQWILDNSTLTESGRQFLYGQRKLSKDVIGRLNIVSLENSKTLMNGLCENFDINMLKDSGLVTVTNGKIYFRMFTPCLLFPYYDKDGTLTGLQSRYLGCNSDAPRFQFVSTQKVRVFNMPIINSMKYGDDLYISEGITDCLALLSSGKKAVAIPSATILPLEDLMNLSVFNLYMYPDQDDTGRKAYTALRRYFINHYALLKEKDLPVGVKDYSEYYIINHEKIKEKI